MKWLFQAIANRDWINMFNIRSDKKVYGLSYRLVAWYRLLKSWCKQVMKNASTNDIANNIVAIKNRTKCQKRKQWSFFSGAVNEKWSREEKGKQDNHLLSLFCQTASVTILNNKNVTKEFINRILPQLNPIWYAVVCQSYL